MDVLRDFTIFSLCWIYGCIVPFYIVTSIGIIRNWNHELIQAREPKQLRFLLHGGGCLTLIVIPFCLLQLYYHWIPMTESVPVTITACFVNMFLIDTLWYFGALYIKIKRAGMLTLVTLHLCFAIIYFLFLIINYFLHNNNIILPLHR